MLTINSALHTDPIVYMENCWAVAHPTWKEALGPIAQVPGVREIGQMILQTPVNQRVPLIPDDLFRWATFPFDQIKVMIINDGQDCAPGWAIGLGPSTGVAHADNTNIVRIVTVASAAVGYPRRAVTNNMSPWAKQGVCLLSVFGSCAAYKEDAHVGDIDAEMDAPWVKFSSHIVELVATKRNHVVFLTMGLWPRLLVAHIALDRYDNHAIVHAGEVLHSTEPALDGMRLAPLIRAAENVFWRVNSSLNGWGLDKVDWAAKGLVGDIVPDGEFRRTDLAIFAHRAQLGLQKLGRDAGEEDDGGSWQEVDAFPGYAD